MRNPHGYAVISSPDGPMTERDCITCVHCQRVVEVKPGSGSTVYLTRWLILSVDPRLPAQIVVDEHAGAMCARCNRPVCLKCHDLGRCIPFEVRLAKMEGRLSFWSRFRNAFMVLIAAALLAPSVEARGQFVAGGALTGTWTVTVALFASSATDPNVDSPVQTPVVYTTQQCLGTTLGSESPPITNPNQGFWEWPVSSGKECIVDIGAQVRRLPAGSYKGAIKVESGSYGSLSTTFTVS